MERKNIVVLGSTGSIGRQALEVIAWFPDRFKLVGLATNRNIDLLEEQVRKFDVPFAAVADIAAAEQFRQNCRDLKIDCLQGAEGLKQLAGLTGAELVLVAVSGTAGLTPTLEAIDRGKTIALANKETLVAGGALVMSAARKRGVQVIPVDSEHSAIHQCIRGSEMRDAGCGEAERPCTGRRAHPVSHPSIARLIITGSGGPFRGLTINQLANVTPEQALKHPTWSMGAKITVDSATLMNKGLEVIEARWLFDVEYERIEVLIHPQSIVHSLVVYRDGVVMAQLGRPDMRTPIQYALCYPEHLPNQLEQLDLTGAELTFARPDLKTFRCLGLARDAGSAGGSMPAVLSAANEAAVLAFMKGRTSFLSIPEIIERVMSRHTVIHSPNLTDILAADEWARRTAEQMLI